MKHFALLILLSGIFLFSSCVVSFENPPSNTQTTPIDSRLFGKWRETREKKGLLNFSRNSGSQTTLELLDENGEQKLLFTIVSVQIGKYYYLTLKPVDEDDVKTFMIARYQIEADEMTIWLPDETKFNELIEKGKLTGSKKSYGEVSVTNSSAEIRKLLESPDSDELFELFGKLKKE